MKLARLMIIFSAVWLTGCSANDDHQQLSPEDNISVELEGDSLDPFISAAAAGDTETILNMLQDGVDINMTDEQGRTAVMAATYHNQIDTVQVLINAGADVNIRDHRLDNVLLYAGAEGNLDVVKLAIKAGADTRLTNRFGGTALIPASERGHVEVVKYLLKYSDIDVNHINNLDWTALLEAVILGDGGKKHQTIVQLLVEHGADPQIGDKNGMIPIEHAQNRGFKEIEMILKKEE